MAKPGWDVNNVDWPVNFSNHMPLLLPVLPCCNRNCSVLSLRLCRRTSPSGTCAPSFKQESLPSSPSAMASQAAKLRSEANQIKSRVANLAIGPHRIKFFNKTNKTKEMCETLVSSKKKMVAYHPWLDPQRASWNQCQWCYPSRPQEVTAVVNFPWPGNGQQVQLWNVIRSPNNSLLGFIVWCLLHLPPEGAKKVETAYFNFFNFLLQVYTSFKKIAWFCWWLVEVKVSSVNVLFSKISFSYRFC